MPGGTFQFRLNVLAGDANRDLSVDRADVAAIAAGFGRSTGANWAAGDFDGDGQVAARDLALLQSQLGDSLAAPSPARSSTAPTIAEPRRLAAKSVRSSKTRELPHDAVLREATDFIAAKPARVLRAVAARKSIASS
jgi:hypothetical protein